MSTRPKSQNVEAPPIAEGSAAKRQVFTRDEVAAILRLSVDTVDSEIKRGKLKSFKRGRHVGVTGAAVDAYLRGAS
jgi:excisionase family DNA binding protein